MRKLFLLLLLFVGVGRAQVVLDADRFDSATFIDVGARTANPGVGGNVRIRDDTGSTRWLAGILGNAAATSFTLRDMVNNVDRLTITSTSGTATATLAANLSVTGSGNHNFSGSILTAGKMGSDTTATPAAMAATSVRLFTNTLDGASLQGFGTNGDVTLLNRSGTAVLWVSSGSTNVAIAGTASAGAGFKATGALTLPTAWTGAHGLGIEYDSGLAGSRIYFGDGTGYSLRWVSRVGSATTDRMVLTDSGTLTVGANLTVGGGTIIGGASEQRIESSATSGRVRISGGTINDGAGVVLGGSTNVGIPNTGILAMSGSTVFSWSATGVAVNSTATVKGVRTATASPNMGSLAAGATTTTTVSVTGAAIGDAVDFNTTGGESYPAGIQVGADVLTANVVTVQFYNPTAASITLGTRSFRVTVTSF